MTTVNNVKIDINVWLPVAHVVKPHGVKGAMFVVTDDRRSDFGNYTKVLLEQPHLTSEYNIKRAYVSGGRPILVLEGVDSCTDADLLNKARIYVLRAEAEKNNTSVDDEDSYLVVDLIGCKVCSEEVGELGTVVAVVNFGAQENLEIKIFNKESTIYFPFLDKYVKNVDLKARSIEIIYTPEFFEDNNT